MLIGLTRNIKPHFLSFKLFMPQLESNEVSYRLLACFGWNVLAKQGLAACLPMLSGCNRKAVLADLGHLCLPAMPITSACGLGAGRPWRLLGLLRHASAGREWAPLSAYSRTIRRAGAGGGF